MGAENSVGIPNFSSESLSRSFALEQRFRKGGVIGVDKDNSESVVRANVEVSNILNTSFSVGNVAETQVNAITNYDSVSHMIEISKNTGLTDRVRKNAEDALYEVGLALSQNKEVFKAATEGRLDEVLVSGLHGIEPYLLSSYLTNGKEDKIGQKRVEGLVDIFRLKKKVEEFPTGRNQKDFEEKIGSFFDTLYEDRENCGAKEVNDGTEGRISLIMGYVTTIDESSKTPVVVEKSGSSEKLDETTKKLTEAVKEFSAVSKGQRGRDQFRPRVNEDGEVEGGVEAAWQVTPEKLAEAMLFMDSSVRWQSYTPPEWFKQLDGETQARIEYMIMVCDGAANLSYAGKDLEKIYGNKMYFAFDNEKFTKLFNGDFKLVMSKMLNDLCELYEDPQTGHQCIRYKEGLNKRGKPGIDRLVEIKLEKIREYKDSLASFLAEQNHRSEPNYLDRMNAYTAWNLFYMFGDSSVADRRRVLPTYGGIISDGLRTLNPEYKALGKWKISKADVPEDSLDAAEWFGGSIGTYVQTVMQLERDLGYDEERNISGKKITVHVDKPLDGKMTLREKITSHKMSFLSQRAFFGFFDFVDGDRVLCDQSGSTFYSKNRKETLSSLLMNYAFDTNGRLKSEKERENFSFGRGQVDFLNTYRDQMEAAMLAFNATTGKEDAKDVGRFVSKVRTAFGMVDGISINGDYVYRKYTRDPNLWANMLLGTFGVDLQRLVGDGVYLRTTQPQAYNLNVGAFITRGLKLTDKDIDLLTLMRLLGIDIKNGEKFDDLKVTLRNEKKWRESKRLTDLFIKESKKKIGGNK